MRTIDLINYLSQFPNDSELNIIIANPDKKVRERYPVKDFFLINNEDDRNFPCFLIGVGKAESLE